MTRETRTLCRQDEDIAAKIADRVSHAVEEAVRDPGPTLDSPVEKLASIAAGVLDDAPASGRDAGQAARGIVRGVLRGANEHGAAALEAIYVTARAILRHVTLAARDITSTACGVAQGSIEGAVELGVEAADAASAAMRGAVEAAEEVCPPDGREVREALAGVIEGVRRALVKPGLVKLG